jgi:transposase InsO family protein
VVDCYTKAVAGWSMADHMRTSLISDALEMAAANVDLAEGCIFHSAKFRQELRDMDIRASVGRTGVCWDNAAAESFFGRKVREPVEGAAKNCTIGGNV